MDERFSKASPEELRIIFGDIDAMGFDAIQYDIVQDTHVAVVDPQEVRITNSASHGTYLGARYLKNHAILETLRVKQAPQTMIDRSVEYAGRSLEDTRVHIRRLVQDDRVQERLVDSDYYEAMPKELSRRILTDGTQTFTPKMLFQSLTTADDETLGDFLVWNKARIDSLSQERAPLIEAACQEFALRITKASEEQGLPVSVAQIRSRLADVTIAITDPMTENEEETAGLFEGNNRFIGIMADCDEEALRATLFHELLHLVSGASMMEIEGGGIRVYRTGIADPSGAKTQRCLSEAVSEQLAACLLSDVDGTINYATIGRNQFFAPMKTTIYWPERKIARGLLATSRSSVHGMLGAYFEDMVPVHYNKMLPQTQKFWWDMYDSYGDELDQILASADAADSDIESEWVCQRLIVAQLLTAVKGINWLEDE